LRAQPCAGDRARRRYKGGGDGGKEDKLSHEEGPFAEDFTRDALGAPLLPIGELDA